MSNQPYNPGGMRRFRLNRATLGWQNHNIIRVTPEGEIPEKLRVFYGDCIAQGCIFTQGFTVLRFLDRKDVEVRTETFETFEACQETYPEVDDSHQYRWQDKCCFRCGADVDHNHGPGFCDACGASWDEAADWPDPSKGRWVHALTLNGPKEAQDSNDA